MNNTVDERKKIPEAWRPEVEARLGPGEAVLGWFEPDLDERLFYARGLVVLTDRRVLASPADPAAREDWPSWPLDPDVALQSGEIRGVGSLDLVGPGGRLAHWRYTVGRAGDAHRLVQRLEAFRRAQAGENGQVLESVCPSCGAVIADGGRCPACSPDETPPRISSLLRLIGFARPRARLIILGFCLSVASTAAALIPPGLTKPLIDNVFIPYENASKNGVPALPPFGASTVGLLASPGGAGPLLAASAAFPGRTDSPQQGHFSLAYWLLAGMAGAAVLAWLLNWARLFVLARVSEYITADLRSRTYNHLQRLSLEFFGGKRTGDLMSRISSDTERLCNFLSLNLVDFGADVLMIVMTTAVLLWMSPLLALVALCPFPLVVYMVATVRGRLLRGYRRAGVAWGEMTSVLADTIPGIRVVKAFAQEGREIERFGESNARVFHANDRMNVLWSFFSPTVTLLTTSGLLIVWVFAAWRIKNHALEIGTVVAFIAYMTGFYARIESMIRMVSATQRAAASAQRIFEILDRVPSVPEPVKPVHPGRVRGRIELRGVRFKYGSREVLHGIDLAIEPGEMVGLVGPSGAGKSTLINLVCRFYDVAAGAILVDGVDVRSYPVEEYRRNIGIVLQDPFLFYGTIAENIAYGKPGATREEIIAAARAARAHEFILRLPDGYDSLVGERGQSLSGGERQRISIARALLIDPRILILDEATSSVDTETEREIQQALENLIRGRTTIAIAHRLSTLRRADRLVVLERGQVAEIGNHHDLLKVRGSYARLHRAQVEMVQGHAV